jgi:integrase
VSQAIEQWLEVVEHEGSTRERYEQLIRLYIEPTLGKLKLAKIDAEILERFYARLLKCRALCSGARRPGHTCEPLAPNTVRKVHFIIRATFERAVRWKYLAVNEAAMAEPPALTRSEPDPPSAEEVASLLNEASNDPEWALLLWLTMPAGWRRGELERSHWGREEKATKSRQGRTIAVDEYTIGLLVLHREACAQDCEALETTLDPDAFVFSLELTRHDGHPR